MIRSGKNESLNYLETIKVEGKSVTGCENIKGRMENFWGKIGKGILDLYRILDRRYDIELVDGNRKVIMELSNPTLTKINRTLWNLKRNNKGGGFDVIP